MRRRVKQADRVLLVFTKTYQLRFEGDEEKCTGLDATFEGVIVTQALYESGGRNARSYLAPLEIPELPGFESDPRRVTNSPYMDDVVAEFAEYLTVWPLLAAVSIRKLKPVPSPPEYVVPQLLMRWVAQQSDLLGIRYFRTKRDPSTNSQDWSVNLALPSRTTRDAGYCDFLASRTLFTPPQRLAAMNEKTLESLVTNAAGDRRQEAGGRYMLRWPDGRLEHYIGTVFGKMEYWLDRPEIESARIRNV
jgi:hypothetical protein